MIHALGGDMPELSAHRLVVFGLAQKLDCLLECFQFGFADQHARVVTVGAGDFDAAVAGADALVEVVKRLGASDKIDRLEASTGHC